MMLYQLSFWSPVQRHRFGERTAVSMAVVEPCRRFTDNAVFAVLQQPLVTGVAAVVLLVLTAAVYPVIYTRRLETAEVLPSS